MPTSRFFLMRAMTGIGLCAVLLGHAAAAQVYSGSLALSSQAEVDAFAYTEVTGILTITGTDIVTLAGLSELTAVEGLFVKDNPLLTSLDGLSRLADVGYYLQIVHNDALTSLDGLAASVRADPDFARVGVEDNKALRSIRGLAGLASPLRTLRVAGNPVLTSLEGIGGIASVITLQVEANDALEDLSGVEGLSEVFGEVRITGNPALTSLTGLRRLHEAPDGLPQLHIERNDALVSLDGLGGFTRVSGISITNNSALTHLDGLGGLRTILVGLIIDGNAALQNLGALANLTEVGRIQIGRNSTLTSLDGLQGLRVFGRVGMSSDLTVFDNAALTSLAGLPPRDSLDSRQEPAVLPAVSIGRNPQLTSLAGLPAWRSLQYLTVNQNDALERLEGLDSLTYVRQRLVITGNRSLQNLNALTALTQVGQGGRAPGGEISITENATLTNVDGLASLTEVRFLTVQANATLSRCSCGLAPLLARDTRPAFLTIAGNAPGCNSPEEVTRNSCAVGTAATPEMTFTFRLDAAFPNPFHHAATLSYTLIEPGDVVLTVFDALGRQVQTLVAERQEAGPHSVRWDGEGLPSGLYVYRLKAGEGTLTRQITLIR